MNMEVRRNKNMIRTILISAVILFFATIMIRMIVPKISIGYLKDISQLSPKYTMFRRFPYFKTKGDLFFIEQTYALSNQIVIFGEFDDTPDLFYHISDVDYFENLKINSFVVPHFICKAEDMLNYRWGWKMERKPLDDYFVLIYNTYQLPPDICCRFIIRGTFYYLIINSVNKFFILAIYAR